VSEGLAEIFSKKYKIPFEVIRNVPTCKQKVQHKKSQDDPFILLYQGVLNEGRGLEEMIAAMEHLPEVECWLAGEGDLSGQIRDQVAQKGLQGKVIFHGRVDPKELTALTAQADVGFNLLENKGLSYYYSLANKAFDYMQAGIPSICMDFPEYAKINAEHRAFYLLEELSPTAIEQAVKRLKNDRTFYQELVENGKKAAEIFVWEQEELKLLDVFGRIN